MWLTRLLKWIGIAVAALALLVLIVIWPVLGVNPFETPQENLWSLASLEVNFFVRFPGTQLLNEPLVRGLEGRRGFAVFQELREQLAEAAAELAREANPQVPLGLFEVDLENDFTGREMAVAGSWQTDFSRVRLDNFIFMTRVAFYPKFVSALKRGFVRSMVSGQMQIEVVKGLYFRVVAPTQIANALRPWRTVKGGPGSDNVFYLARVRDVLMFSDNALWIEDALQGGVRCLPADAWFESEFIQTARGGNAVELFARPSLTHGLMMRHTRGNVGAALSALRALIPTQVLGELTVHLQARGGDGIEFDASNVPQADRFKEIAPHLLRLYEGEKGDPQVDFSENGIGRFVPRERCAGMIVLHAKPQEFVDLVTSIIPKDEMDLADDEVRATSRGGYTGLHDLLSRVTEDLADTHLLIVHRPSVFETADLSTYKDQGDQWIPDGQFSYTLISRVKDSVIPDKVREKIFQNLQHLGFNSAGPHESGKFHLASFITEPSGGELIRPAYGAMVGGMNYFVISTSVEAAEAVYEAAEDPEKRLLAEPAVARLAQQLPRQASLALVLFGPTVHAGMLDHVRAYATLQMDVPNYMTDYMAQFVGSKDSEPSYEERKAEEQRYIAETYPEYREEYERLLAWMDSFEGLAFACSFGVGSEKKVKAQGFVQFATGGE